MKRNSFDYDQVDELFDNAPDGDEFFRRCPITGGAFTKDDRIKPIKDRARRAIAARDWFDKTGPLEYCLPLIRADREALKGAFDEGYIVALFARSLAAAGWLYKQHVEYPEYAAGVLALSGIGERILACDPSLANKYPPRALQSLDGSGYYEPDRRYRNRLKRFGAGSQKSILKQ